MTDQLTATIQKLETQYGALKKYFESDGKVTPDEVQALKVVQSQIDAVRKMAQERTVTTKSGSSVKADAKGSKGSGGIEIKNSVERTVVQTHDSIQVTEKHTSGADVNVKAGGFGANVGTTDSKEKSTKVTNNDKGTVDVDTKSTYTRENNLSGSMSVGVAGMEVGTTHTKKTSFGYSITVDLKKDPDGKIREWLGHCNSPQDYEVFLAANAGKVTLTGRTVGKGTGDATNVGVSLGPAKASIGTNKSVEEETTTDDNGNLVKRTIAGKGGAGGKALWKSDSVQDEAVAEIDGKGRAKVTLTRTKTDGAVDKSGLGLSNGDLKLIGEIAFASLPSWMDTTGLRADDKKDWRNAGVAIAQAKGAPSVVAEQLARFVGGAPVERMKVIQNLVRNGYKGRTIGRRFEFPDALKRLQQSYEVVTAESLPAEMDRLAASNRAAALDKCKGLLKIADLLDPQLRNSKDFDNNATQAEMLTRLVNRRKLLAEAIKGFGGESKPQEDLKEAKDRLWKQLTTFSVAQARVGAKLYELLSGEKQFLSRELAEAKGLIRQLNDLHKRWRPDYTAMSEMMSKLGITNWDAQAALKPDEAMLARYEKAAGVH